MANPAGLQTGIDNIAQLNNAYVLASWPADPVQDNVVSYEVQYWKSAGDVSGTATSISGLVVTDNSQSWVAGSLVGARVAMGGMTANVVDNSATTFTVDAWVTGTPAAGAYQISYTYSRRVFGTSLKIDGLFTGTGYTFRLRAQNNVGIWSAWSALKSITTASDTLSPGAPTGLKAYKTPRGALVSWGAVVAADVQGYQVEDVLALQTAITSGGTVTAIAVPPLPVATSPSATITVDSENYTVTGAGAAAGATSIPVVSQVAGASHALNAPVYCQQYIFPAASLTTSLVFTAPSGTPLGTQLQFRVRAQDWSGNFSAWSALSTAITSDGTVFDELMAGNLKVFGTITTGGLQTAASGARFDLNSSRIAGFDNSATNYGLPGGAGNTFWLGADGNAQLKGTLWATIVNASVFLGTGTPPSYTTPSTGFSVEATNGFRWWNAGTLVAQWAANGALTIFSGATITASTIQSASNLGTINGPMGFKLDSSGLRIYSTTHTSFGTVSTYISFLTTPDPTQNAPVEGAYIKASDWGTFGSAGNSALLIYGSHHVQIANSNSLSWISVNGTGGIQFNSDPAQATGYFSFAGGGIQADATAPFAVANNVPVLISHQVTSFLVQTVSFQNIPQGFRHLRLYVCAIDHNAVPAAILCIGFNNDTGTNYDQQLLSAIGASVTGGASTSVNSHNSRIGVLKGASAGFTGTQTQVIDIADYTSATRHGAVGVCGRNDGSAGVGLEINNVTWHPTTPAAITEIDFVIGNSDVFEIGSVFTLMGIP